MLSEAASLSSVQDPFLDLVRSKASFTTTHVEKKHEQLNLFFPGSFSIILPDPDHVSVEAKGLEVLNYTSTPNYKRTPKRCLHKRNDQSAML